MGIWIKHPRTKQEDTMLSIAVAGFILAGILTVAGFVAAWITGSGDFLKYLATIDAALLTPSLGAYTARKYSDIRHGNGHHKEEEKKDA